MKRKYSLFVREGSKYVRLVSLAMYKPQAVVSFQSALLSGSFRGYAMYLRPVNDFGTLCSPAVDTGKFNEVFPKANPTT